MHKKSYGAIFDHWPFFNFSGKNKEQILVKRQWQKVKTRTGIWVTAHEHKAYFCGNHNSAKVICYLFYIIENSQLKAIVASLPRNCQHHSASPIFADN
jgi:hypothetical protein